MSKKHLTTKKYRKLQARPQSEGNLSLSGKIMRALTAVGFVLAPWAMPMAAEAADSTITRAGSGTTVTNGNVHNVYADQVSGTVATNRFTDFTIAQHEIANMHFKTKDGTTEATSLFNFVQNQINVAGTVNAVKSNTIGGHMYFLSPNGMVVSGSGVINAGSLTVMAGGAFPGSDSDALSYASNITGGTYTLDSNKKSLIQVAGQINAADDITLKSNKELIIDGGELNAKLNAKASTSSTANDRFDFSSVVNTTDASGNAVNAGLTGELLVARSTGNGDITLEATTTEYNSAMDSDFSSLGDENKMVAQVEIQQDATINADGAVSITASTDNEESVGTLISFGNIGQTSSSITIDGTINAGTIAIDSSTNNTYELGFYDKFMSTIKNIGGELIQNNIWGSEYVNIDIGVIHMKAESTVNINANARLTASSAGTTTTDSTTGTTTSTAAFQINSTSNMSVTNQVTGRNSSSGSDELIGLGVLYTNTKNYSTINIDEAAHLQSAGSLDVASAMKTNLTAGAAVKPMADSDSYGADVALAMVISTGETASTINVGNYSSGTTSASNGLLADATANTLQAEQDVQITSGVETITRDVAEVRSSQNVYGSTTVVYYDMDTSSTINVDAQLVAGNDMLVDATDNNKITSQSTTSLTTSGLGTWIGFLGDMNGNYSGMTRFVIDKVKGLANCEHYTANAWQLGIALNYTKASNKAAVAISEDSVLTAGNDLIINADQYYTDYKLVTTGMSSLTENNTTINVAIGVGVKDDGATVTIGGTDSKHAQLKATSGDLSITANDAMVWQRTKNMQNSIRVALDQFLAAQAAVIFADLPTTVQAYKDDASDDNFDAILSNLLSNDSDVITWLQNAITSGTSAAALYRAAMAYTDAASYTNINVGATARSNAASDSSIAVAVSGAITDFKTNAKVIVGQDVELTAGGKLSLDAQAKQVDVNYYGTTQSTRELLGLKKSVNNLLLKMEADIKALPSWNKSNGSTYGGNLAVNVNEVQSGVVVAEGAQLKGDSVAMTAATDLQRILVTLGGGQAGASGASGMIDYHTSTANSIVSVDDEAQLTTTGTDGISLTADNDALLVAVQGDVMASSGATAIGVAVGLETTEFNTYAGIKDNDQESISATYSDSTKDEEVEKAYYATLGDLLSSDELSQLGTAATDLTTGAVSTSALNITATSSPVLWNIGVAGGVSTGTNVAQADAEVMIGDLFGDDDLKTKVTAAGALSINKITGNTAALLENTPVTLTGTNRAVNLYAYDDAMAVAVDGSVALQTKTSLDSSFNAMISGTAAVNLVEMNTISQVEDATITDALAVTNEAKQAEKIVATAAPVAIDASSNSDTGFSVALNASVNSVDNGAHANLTDTTVKQSDTDSSNTTRVQNVAYDKSLEVTGGLEIDVAKSSVGVGINAVWAKLGNDVAANISGGSYTQIGALENLAASNLTHINLALGVGVGSGQASTLTAGAVWNNVTLDNDTTASIGDGAVISAVSLQNEAFDGDIANETTDDTWTTTTEGSTTTAYTKTELLSDWDIDAEGSSITSVISSQALLEDVDTTAVDNKVSTATEYTGGTVTENSTTTSNYTNTNITFSEDKQTLIINGSVLVEVSSANQSVASGAAAVNTSLVDSDYTASISDVDITLSKTDYTTDSTAALENVAQANSEIITVAAGLSASNTGAGKFNAAGSAAAVTLANDTQSTITGSTLDATQVEVAATTDSEAYTVAGAISGNSGSVGVGLTLALNTEENSTTAKILGSKLNSNTSNTLDLSVTAENTAKLYAIAAGIALNTATNKFAAGGNVAVNSGYNNTIALIDALETTDSTTKKTTTTKTYITNASNVAVSATNENSKQMAVAVGLDVGGGTVNVGAGMSVNSIKNETMQAAINNTELTTTSTGTVSAVTNEKAQLTSVAAGLAFSAGTSNFITFDGAGALTLTNNKVNSAGMSGTLINGTTAQKATVTLQAQEDNTIINNADAITARMTSSVSGALGIGVSVVKLDQSTSATAEESTIQAQDVLVDADAANKIYNVGVGIGFGEATGDVAFTGAASLSVNLLEDDVTAKLADSTVNATNNVGVLSQGKDTLVDVTGGLDLNFGGVIGVGLAVAYNDLSGDITSTVSDSQITALGTGTSTLTNHIFTTDATTNAMTLSTATHHGVVVDAYGDHDATNVVLSLGFTASTGSTEMGAELEGLGASTNLSGTTGAYLTESDVNKDYTTGSGVGDVVVTAQDQNTTHDVNVNVSGAGSDQAALAAGIAVSMAELNRTVDAKVTGDSTNKNTVNANELVVLAGGKNYGHMVSVGVDASIASKVSLAAGALADCISSSNTITAGISNITSVNNGTTLQAAHDNQLTYTGVGVVLGVSVDPSFGLGAGVGVAVGTVTETNTITGTLENTTITHKTSGAVDDFAVTNYSYSDPNLVATTFGFGILGADVGVSVDNHSLSDALSLNVLSSSIGDSSVAATTAGLHVKNYYYVDKGVVNVSLALAVAGASVGVNVQPTSINSAEVMNVTGSQLYADTLTLETEEYRKLDTDAVTVSGASVAGIGVTRTYITTDGKLMTTYQTQNNGEDDDDYSDDLETKLTGANSAISNAKTKIATGVTNGAEVLAESYQNATSAETAETLVDEVQGTAAEDHLVTTGVTASSSTEGLKIATSGNTITSDTVLIQSTVKDDIDVYSGTGGFAVLNVNINAARVDEHIQNVITMNGDTISAENISVLANVTGTTYTHAAIGSVGAIVANVAYADMYVDGTLHDEDDNEVAGAGNSISIADANINTTSGLLVRACQDGQYKTYVNGGGADIIGGGYVEAESKDSLTNSVSITGTTLKNMGTYSSTSSNVTDTTATQATAGAMEMAALKQSLAQSKTLYGSVRGVGGYTNSTTSQVAGTSTVTVSNNTITDVSSTNTSLAGLVDVYAQDTAEAETEMTYGSGSVIAGGGGVYGSATHTGGAVLNVNENSFDVVNLQATTQVGSSSVPVLATAKVEAINVTLGFGVGLNEANSTVTTASEVNMAGNTFATQEVEVASGTRRVEATGEDGKTYYTTETVYTTEEAGKTQLTLTANTEGEALAKIGGATVAGAVAVGNNETNLTETETTAVTLAGGTTTTALASLDVMANGHAYSINQADGSGGAAGADISPSAAEVYNTVQDNTGITLGGSFDVSGAINLAATQTDEMNMQAVIQAGSLVVTVIGSDVTNKVTGTTAITLTEATLNAQSLTGTATNYLYLNTADDYEYAIDAETGTLLSDNAADNNLNNTITKTAAIAVGGEAAATDTTAAVAASQITTQNDLTLASDTEASLNIKGKYNSLVAVVDSDAQIDTTSVISYTNDITIGEGAALETTAASGDINLSSADTATVQVGSYAFSTSGLITVADACTENTINRTNTLNVAGNITSANDLLLYAGEYTDNRIAGLDAIIDTVSYSGGIISPRYGTLKNTVNQTDTVTIAQGATTTSVASTDVYALDGTTTISTNNIRYCIWSNDNDSSTYTSYTEGSVTGNGVTNLNKAIINGTMTAGSNHIIDVTLDGLVFVDEEERTYINANGYTATATPTISGTNTEALDDASYYVSDIGAELEARYEELSTAIMEYSTENKTEDEAYETLVAARAAVLARLQQLGLIAYEQAYDDAGNALYDENNNAITVMVINAGSNVNVMELPDLAASGGNITFTTDNLESTSGSMTAYGTPTINITNNSNLYLKLNNITVGDLGGAIELNDTVIEASTGTSISDINSQIQSLNEDTGTTVGFSKVHGEYDATAESSVAITNTAEIQTFDISGTKDGVAFKSTVKTMPAIELSEDKTITNTSGSVTLTNKHSDILVNGNIYALSTVINAEQGSVYQVVESGVIGIGGDVKEQYADKLSALRTSISNNWSTPTSQTTYQTGTASDDTAVTVTGAPAGTIAGSSIYIAGESINLNGIIQSGYEDYKVNVTDQAAIDKLDSSWDGSALTDSQVMKDAYCVCQGQTIYDETKGYYYYQPAAYYNPSTKKIIVASIESYPGNIYLSGTIASTGNGKVYALDGTYDITINNTTHADLQLGTLATTTATGKITIVDAARGTQTIITKAAGAMVTATSSTATTTDVVTTNENGTYTYNPKEGLRFNWVTGTEATTKTYYQRYIKKNWWGAHTSEDITSNLEAATKVKELTLDSSDKTVVGYISASTDAAVTEHNMYVSGTDNYLYSTTSDVTVTTWKSGFLGFNKYYQYDWTVTTGSNQQYLASVKADQPVQIGFMGKESATIDVDSVGSITLTNNIGNADYSAKVSLTSSGGDIVRSNGYIKSADVDLSALGSMENIQIMTGETLNLQAINTATASSTYYRQGVGTTVSNGNAMNLTVTTTATEQNDGTINYGTVNLVSASGNVVATTTDDTTTIANGDNTLVTSFSLTSSGGISGTSNAINAMRVDLTATHGSIGSAEQAVFVNSGDQPTGDDTLSASVNAQAAGDIYLTETEGDMRVGTIYSTSGDVYLTGSASLVDALPYTETSSSGRSDAELVELWQSMGLVGSKVTYKRDSNNNYLETTTANEYPIYVNTFDADGNATKTQKTDASGNLLYYVVETTTSVWDAQKLLYSISDSLINRESGVEASSKAPNIQARNLTLTMGDSAGLNEGTETTYDLFAADNLETMKALAKTDASNVTDWTTNDQGVVTAITVQQKLPVGVELSGTVTVTAGTAAANSTSAVVGNAYVEMRREDKTDTSSLDLQLQSINAIGNVLLKNSSGSIVAASGATGAVITAQGLDINAGGTSTSDATTTSFAGSVGTDADNPLLINITGNLQATGTAGVYIYQNSTNAFSVQSVSSGGDIYLRAANSIISQEDNAGYLRLEQDNTTITLLSDTGSIGSAAAGMRILNADALTAETTAITKTVTATAEQGNIYLEGVTQNVSAGSTDPLGTLYLAGLLASDVVVVNDNGNITLIDNSNLTGENVTLTAELAIDEATTAKVKASTTLTATASAGIDLGSQINELLQVALYNSTSGDIALGNGGGANLTVTAVAKSADSSLSDEENLTAGNVTIHNYDDVQYMADTNEQTLDTVTDNAVLISGKLLASGALSIINDEADTNSILGGTGPREALQVLESSTITAGSVALTTTSSEGRIANAGTITGTSGITLTASGSDYNNGSVVYAISNTGVLQDKATGGTLNEPTIFLHALNGTINNTNTIYGDKVCLHANQDIWNTMHSETSTEARYIEGKTWVALYTDEGAIRNSSNIISGQEVNIIAGYAEGESSSADLYNYGYGNITAQGNVSLMADGNITNKKNIHVEAEGDITLSAGGNVENGDAVNANKGIMVTESGDITITSAHGYIANYTGSDLLTGAGNVKLTATYVADAYDCKYSVTNAGDLLALGGNIELSSASGDVTNLDDFDTLVDTSFIRNGDVARYVKQGLLEDAEGVAISTADITLKAPLGTLYNKQDIAADGNVTLEAQKGLGNFAMTIYAGKNISLKATAGNLVNKAELVSVNGNVTLEAVEGTVVNMLGGQIVALAKDEAGSTDGSVMGNVTLKAGAAIEATHTVYIVDTEGNVSKLDASLPSDVDATSTIITNVTETTVDQKKVYTTNFQYIDANGDKKDLLDSSGEKLTKTGLVEAFRTGDVINRGDIVALGTKADENGLKGISLLSEHGNVANYDNFATMKGGDATVETNKSYAYQGSTHFNKYDIYSESFAQNISNWADISKWNGEKGQLVSKSSIALLSPEGYFFDNMNIASTEDVSLTTAHNLVLGDASLPMVLAGQDLQLQSTQGKVLIKGSYGAINNASMLVTLTDDANDTEGTELAAGKNITIDGYYGVEMDANTVLKSDEALAEAMGNTYGGGAVLIAAHGVADGDKDHAGNIRVASIEAVNSLAAVGTGYGDIEVLGSLKGQDVILYSEGADSHIDVPDITVGSNLVIQSNTATIGTIARAAADGALNMEITGVNGETMQGDITVVTPGNTHYTNLNVTHATIKVTEGGTLGIDRLHVAAQADIEALNYQTNVYGSLAAPYHDAGEAIYYDAGRGTNSNAYEFKRLFNLLAEYKTGDARYKDMDAAIGEARYDKLAQGAKRNSWGTANDGWMNLYIDEPRYQRSNGLLLHIAPYYYSSYQRYALDDLSELLLASKATAAYDVTFTTQVNQFQRTDLYELPEMQPSTYAGISNPVLHLEELANNEVVLGIRSSTYDGINNPALHLEELEQNELLLEEEQEKS